MVAWAAGPSEALRVRAVFAARRPASEALTEATTLPGVLAADLRVAVIVTWTVEA
jgi:hypothetical protein